MSLLEDLIAQFRSATEQSAQTTGKCDAILVGADVPVELLNACGWTARRLAGNPRQPTLDADYYLGSAVDAPIRSIFQQLLDGHHNDAQVLVIANDNASHFRLYYALCAMRDKSPERTAKLPRLLFFDLLHLDGTPTAAYNLTRASQLREALGGCSDEALREAISERDMARKMLIKLRVSRKLRQVRGTDMLTVYQCFASTSPDIFLPLLSKLLTLVENSEPIQAVPIFLTGSTQDHDEYYRAIEAKGFIVVGEDHDWGDRGSEAMTDLSMNDPLAALVERYRAGSPASAKFTTRARAHYTSSQASASGSEAVVALVRKDDPAPRWDIARQRGFLAPTPLFLIDDLPYNCADPAVFGEELNDTFIITTAQNT